jgi:hypothetical protein
MNRRTFLKSVVSGGLSRVLPFSLTSSPAFAQQTATHRTVKQFSAPAKIRDLPGAGQSLFDDLWHTHLEAFTQQAICGDPWSKVGMSHEFYYFNPTSTLMPGAVQLAMISWTAFPNRLNLFRDRKGIAFKSLQAASELRVGAGRSGFLQRRDGAATRFPRGSTKHLSPSRLERSAASFRTLRPAWLAGRIL